MVNQRLVSPQFRNFFLEDSAVSGYLRRKGMIACNELREVCQRHLKY